MNEDEPTAITALSGITSEPPKKAPRRRKDDEVIEQERVPTEDEIEIRDGQRRTVKKKLYPGYVLVQTIELKEGDPDSDEAWHMIRNTTGVTGFVSSGARPVPLSADEE